MSGKSPARRGGICLPSTNASAEGQTVSEMEGSSSKKAIRTKTESNPEQRPRKAYNFLTDLTKEQVTAFKEAFDLFDSNGGGTIDAVELDEAFKSVDIALTHEEINDVLEKIDADGNGEIDFMEFLQLMTSTERYLEMCLETHTELEHGGREAVLFDALTQFMKRSALHSVDEIVGYYTTKYKRVQAPHVVGHYAAGARLIGLNEKQIAQQLKRLKASHAASDIKSPYAQPLRIFFIYPPRKIKKPKPTTTLQELQKCGRIRLRVLPLIDDSTKNAQETRGDFQDHDHSFKLPRSTNKQLKRNQDLDQETHGWRSQRTRHTGVKLPVISHKTALGRPQAAPPTFNEITKIREKVSQARKIYHQKIRMEKKIASKLHWNELSTQNIKSDLLRNHFRQVFAAYSSPLQPLQIAD